MRQADGVQQRNSQTMRYDAERLSQVLSGSLFVLFSENDIKLLHLDYDSQNDPQLIMKEYLSTKNFDLLYSWWKEHYKASLKNCDNPKAIILRLASSD